MIEFVFFILGLCLGGGATWWVRRSQFEFEKGIPLSEFHELKSTYIQVDAEKKGLDEQLDDLKLELKQERGKNEVLTTQLSTSKANCLHLEEKLQDQKQSLEENQKKLKTEFENLATTILEKNTEKFAKQNQMNLDGILKPFNEKLKDFKEEVGKSYVNESKERASLKGEISKLFELNQTMAKEAKNLTTALKGDVKTQGNWGELILQKILERSGLQKNVEFKTQAAYQTEDGKRQHPDVVIYLPEEKNMIIDAKVSLTAYERYFSTEDESDRESQLTEHIQSIRQHVKQLSNKNYQNLYQVNSPDFVLMFMPIEPAFGLAVQHDPKLFYEAFDQNVVIVSPSTLLVTLQIIANIWKQEKQNKNAIEIARQGGDLYDKFVSFVKDLEKLGSQLKTVSVTYDASMNKLTEGRGNLINRAEKIKELGAKASKSISEKYINRDPSLKLSSNSTLPSKEED